MPEGERRQRRQAILREMGADDDSVAELLRYNDSPFDAARLTDLELPLADERHLGVWEEYEREARADGILPALARRLVQLRFPIEAGISQTDAYRAATRRGVWPDGTQSGVVLRQPEALTLTLHPTLGGRVPILVAGAREDFVTLVRALSSRNEPEPVPDAMGACIVNGLNNWDRVARHRRAFEPAGGGAGDDAAWAEEFRRMAQDPTLYQDRLIVLSRGPYSAVQASDVGWAEADWRARSLVIRREHECTHYFTLRVFGAMRNNVLDELVADFSGLTAALGRYDGDLALRFFGLEHYPRYRAGGRLESYLGQPPLTPRSVAMLHALLFTAIRNIEHAASSADRQAQAHWVSCLATSTLEELSSEDYVRGLKVDARP